MRALSLDAHTAVILRSRALAASRTMTASAEPVILRGSPKRLAPQDDGPRNTEMTASVDLPPAPSNGRTTPNNTTRAAGKAAGGSMSNSQTVPGVVGPFAGL